MAINLNYKNEKNILKLSDSGVPFLEYPILTGLGVVKHGFSTRLGGVSQGCFESMNLSFTRGDREEDVRENFRRIAKAIGVRCEDMVFSQQTHTTNVRVVTAADRGMGMVRPLEYQDVDGLVTNVPGICLVTFYADCVPLFFVDPVKRVIGLSHSGWRGTVGKIGKRTVELMEREYGCNPKEIYAAIGPSICQDCYEVSGEVIEQFQQKFHPSDWKQLFYQKENGKFQLNLWNANELILREAGICEDHITVTNVCTHCNSDVLFSHRTTGDKRGNLAAFLALKEQ